MTGFQLQDTWCIVHILWTMNYYDWKWITTIGNSSRSTCFQVTTAVKNQKQKHEWEYVWNMNYMSSILVQYANLQQSDQNLIKSADNLPRYQHIHNTKNEYQLWISKYISSINAKTPIAKTDPSITVSWFGKWSQQFLGFICLNEITLATRYIKHSISRLIGALTIGDSGAEIVLW
jgi:hypothetical protein